MFFGKKKLVFLFTLILILSFSTLVSSQTTCEAAGFMGKFQQNSNVTITQVCPTCTFLNITVTDPDSVILFENEPMTLSNGIFSFGPNSTLSSELGVYFVQGVSNLDNPFKSCYVITNIQTEITTPESIVYVILVIVVFTMFVFCVWGGIGLPGPNRRNEVGRVISIEKWKYVKLGFIFLSYPFFVWFINIVLTLSLNFVTLTQFAGFFTMMFQFLVAGLYAWFVVMIIVFFVIAARDLKLVSLLTRGIKPR